MVVLKLTIDDLELMFENLKKVLGGFNGSFLSNFVGKGYIFKIFLKRMHFKNKFEKLCFKS